ncbi:hypothetical protein G6F58_013096 [Rhizopus delemar]|nr:hypothetical protein G6F58_013096 [Rhizopus delemar]
MLLLDMRAPGVTVRPIRTLDGGHDVNEVWLEDVRVPVSNLVGEENQGWTYAKYLLGHERTGIAGLGHCHRELGILKQMAARAHRHHGAGNAAPARGVQQRRHAGPRGLGAEDPGLRAPAGSGHAANGSGRAGRVAV